MKVDALVCSINNASLLDAWKVINNNMKGTAFIVDDTQKLLGVITDGDIRRHLIHGGALEGSIRNVMNTDFVSAHINESGAEMMKKISSKIKIIPIVDDAFRLVDYFEFRSDVYIPVASPDLKGNELNYLMDAFLSTWISSSGSYINKFEQDFSHFCECAYGVAVSNGTVAIHLALEALGIGKGDEVIVPDLTFAATANAVFHAKAKPVIVDVDEKSWTISISEIEKAITPKTKAIIPVHLYGQPCDMDEIMLLAQKHNLFVIEDCAEAHGAKYKGKMVGSFGHISCFSFFGNKIITTGEGGMCVTNDPILDAKMRMLRDHGMSKEKKYWHEEIGFNYRMTNLQASIGCAQLERINEILETRKQLELRYRDALSDVKVVEFQTVFSDREKITWLVSALIPEKRDQAIAALHEAGIDARPFFYSLGIMPPYKDFVFSNNNSIKLSESGINLPTNAFVDDAMIEKIKAILEAL